MSALGAGEERFSRVQRVAEWLARQTFELVPGHPFKLGALLADGVTPFPRTGQAQGPAFVFDPAGTKTDRYNSRGLDAYGPYTAQTFTPTTPRVAVVCQRRLKGEVEQFLHKLLYGIPDHTGRRSVFARGLIDTYRLDGWKLDFFLASDASASAYHRAAQEALSAASEGAFRWNLALVQSFEDTHTLRGEENPYLVTKAAFLALQVPTQEFEIETARSSEYALRYTLSNMALQCYAKLDGIPWLLKANPTIAHEVVIGLGSAQLSPESRFAERERFVGITTVFTGDGNYFMSNLSRAAAYDDYPEALLTSLRQSVSQIKTALNWQPRDHVRLVFHTFKPLKDAEVNAVEACARTR